MFRWLIISLLSFLLLLPLNAQKVKVSIFNEFNVKNAIVSPFKGTYKVIADSVEITNIDTNDVLYITFLGKFINIRDESGDLGSYHEISLKGNNPERYLKIKPLTPSMPHRFYRQDLTMRSDYNRLLLLNVLGLEDYLPGVVLAECGAGWHAEFYKAHAVIARTYALKNIDKHTGEGFHLCDDVHCQAYKGKSDYPTINKAIVATAGEVLVDQDTNLITAAFFSNCGGETQNSENVWLQAKTYLRSVEDPFCTNGRNAYWKRSLTLAKWKNYLRGKGMKTREFSGSDFNYYQPHRRKYYDIGGGKVLLRDIRNDWGFPSSFFSVKVKGNTVVFSGKGYGHGVGLCQEGAMQMAKMDYDYKQIIDFYYKDVRHIDVSEWNLLKSNLSTDIEAQ